MHGNTNQERSKATKRRDSSTSPSLSFVQYLETKLRDSPPRQKGQRTCERLKIATAKMLEKRGYYVMRVADITENAGLAEGSFYVYFNDKKAASLTVLAEFLKEFVDLRALPEVIGLSFESMREGNRRWIAFCRANSGLMRCVLQVGDEDPDFARLVQEANLNWYVRLAGGIERGQNKRSKKTTLLAVYMLCSMMDELVRKLIVHPDREFHKLLKAMKVNDDTIADAVTLIWLRLFNSEAKRPDGLAPAAAEFAKLVWGY